MRKVIILFAIIWLSGCALITGPENEFQAASVSVKEKRYKEAVAAYKKIAADSPGSTRAADALFELALVHATPDNPQRDYAQAAHTFEEFLKRYPDDKRALEARRWIAVLKVVLELKKDNERLNNNIDELKRLDIKHEERRRK